MAAGDTFLGFLKDAVNSLPVVGAYTTAAWGPGNYDPNAAPSGGLTLGSVVNAVPLVHAAGEAVGFASDHIAPLKFALDLPNRTVDSFITGVQDANMDDGSDRKST